MKMQITTIILFVQDAEKLKKFYTEQFQLSVIEEIPAEWVLLDAGGCRVGLHRIGKEYPEAAGENFKAESNAKIVFETEEDLVMVREKLIKEKITLQEIKMFPSYNFWICDGEDPEGNVFQLRQKKG